MSKKDINFLSVTEPGTVIEDRQIIVPLPPVGSYWSDAVHVNVPDVIIRRCVIDARNCEENAIDGNHSSNLLVEDCDIYAGKECALYAKCFQGVIFRRCHLITVGGHSDGYTGDYSDQSKARTTGVVYDSCLRADGQPFRLSWNFRRCDKPLATGTPHHYQLCLSAERTAYVELKYAFPKIVP